jgi:hypothetical protein
MLRILTSTNSNGNPLILVPPCYRGALTWENQAQDSDKVQQLLMSTEDAGMIQVIKATVAAMTILQRADELMLLAPTGATAYDIGGNTIHHALRTGVRTGSGGTNGPGGGGGSGRTTQ